MANQVSMTSWNESVQASQPLVLDYVFEITAAKTVKAVPSVLTAFDAISSQSVIDSFLGTTNEFLVAAFDSTSMGTDAFAMIINMGGQAKSVVKVDAMLYTAAGAVTSEKHVLSSAALTASTLETKIAKGADGDIGVKLVLTDLDSATSGHIHVQIQYFAK